MKRFTETEKWDDPWFRKLSPGLKCFWFYLCDKCDASGVWKVDLELAAFFIGTPLTEEEIKAAFADRIVDLGRGRWLVRKFMPFQYGTLSKDCRPHQKIIQIAHSHGLKISGGTIDEDTLPDTLLHTLPDRVVDRDKEKDKDKEEDKDKDKGKDRERGTGENPRPSGIPANEREAVGWADMEMVPADFAKEVFHQCEGINWVDGSQRPITNWRSYIKSRWSRQQKVTIDGAPKAAGKPPSVLAVKSTLDSKKQRAKEIRDRHYTDGPVNGSWDSEFNRLEYRQLRDDIKTLEQQMELLAK